jgi:predicted alpha/beta hydrolase family esterase
MDTTDTFNRFTDHAGLDTWFGPRGRHDLLIVPGRDDSGPDHWQTRLQHAVPNALRVVQNDWANPELTAWSIRVAETTAAATRPVVAVAHSFGCLATLAAVMEQGANFAAALLVAPAAPNRFAIDPARLRQAANLASLLVASRNDPWMGYETAFDWAAHWGSDWIDAGWAGHINVDSGHGDWLMQSARAGNAGRAVLPAPSFPPPCAIVPLFRHAALAAS